MTPEPQMHDNAGDATDREHGTPGRTWRIFLVPAVLALVGYVVLYSLDARLKTRRGPWQVEFLAASDGMPAVRISQPALGITNITVRFKDEQVAASAVLPGRVLFDEPLKAVPFGRTAFDDLMYLPGTVVLHCFGHEVQMLPRALYLDRRERPWRSGEVVELDPTTKPAALEPPPKRGRRAPPSRE